MAFQEINTFINAVPVWLLLPACLLLYGLAAAVYRLTFHPLAKYPGPLFWKISVWPTVWSCAGGRRHMLLEKIHQKYGSVVRIGPNMLSFDTGTSAATIYGPRHANLEKSEFHLTLDATVSAPSVFALTDRTKHAFRRRVLAHAFTDNAMNSAGEFVLYHTHILRDILNQKVANGWTKVNMGDYATWWGQDVMGSLALGTSFSCLTKPQYRNGIPLMRSAAKFTYWAGHLPFRRLVDLFLASPTLSKLGGKSAVDNQNYFDFCEGQLQQRIEKEEQDVAAEKKEEESRKDYIHYLLHATDPETGKSMTREELKTDTSLILAAGSDAIANSFAAVMFYLARNPRPFAKACAEVRSTFTTAEEILVGHKLNSCVYLLACIDEAMRMAPVSASPLERTAVADGIEVDGCHIPAGITVGTFFYGMNFNKKSYRTPFTYWPERWIVDKEGAGVSEDEVALARQSFFPFSNGHRQCVAKILASRNLRLVVATLFWHFDIRIPEKFEPGEPSGEGEVPGLFGLDDCLISVTQGPVIEMRSRFKVR